MIGLSSPWPPCSCAPSSVTQWLLYRTVLITVLFGVASSSSDWCNHLQSDFTGHVQTIGPLDGRLWAITTEWIVHEMTPCDKGNETLSLCIEIGFPISVETKWPELAKSVKEHANVTDFNFTVDNSVFMNSSANSHFLIMHGKAFKPKEYFGFNFNENEFIKTVTGEQDIFKALWIPSDEKIKAYKLYDKQFSQIEVTSDDSTAWMIKEDYKVSPNNICKISHGDDLSLRITADKCNNSEMDWTIMKAVRYGDQFYFFAQDQVYIFAAVENVTTRVNTVHYDSFIHCKEPTTTTLPTSPPSNVTKSAITTVSEHNLTSVSTTEGSNKTMIFVGVGVVAILVIIAIIVAIVCCRKQSKSSQKEVAKLGCNSKASSKVNSTKAASGKKPESQAGQNKKATSQADQGKKATSQADQGKKATSQVDQGKKADSKVGLSIKPAFSFKVDSDLPNFAPKSSGSISEKSEPKKPQATSATKSCVEPKQSKLVSQSKDIAKVASKVVVPLVSKQGASKEKVPYCEMTPKTKAKEDIRKEKVLRSQFKLMNPDNDYDSWMATRKISI